MGWWLNGWVVEFQVGSSVVKSYYTFYFLKNKVIRISSLISK